jgi:aerobic carbon-monoxide dehydrogenase large subunit
VGGVPCFSNAVHDAFGFLGVTNLPMPHYPHRLWQTARQLGL